MNHPTHKEVFDQIAMRSQPTVRIVGNVEHADFLEAVAMLRADADLSRAASPELIVVLQERPGLFSARQVGELRREAPLAGLVAVAGSWCEGETRTGRPLPGVLRYYWHEFPAWWRRQTALRERGWCPEWARPNDFGFRISDFGLKSIAIRNPQSAIRNSALIAIAASAWETAESLADVLHRAGYATVWRPDAGSKLVMRGVVAGIWEGGQLDEREAGDLATFSRQLARYNAPVVAVFDFPRRDRVDRAIAASAAAVLGKPWSNAALVETMQWLISRTDGSARKARLRAA